jgi:hypothetical protein
MAKFNVHFYERAGYTVPVEADSEDEAIEKAEKMLQANRDTFWADGELIDVETELVDEPA